MGPTDRPAIGPLIAARAGGGGCTLLLLLLLVVAVLEAPITVIELPLSCRQMAEERLKSECPSTRVIPLAALLHLPMWLKPRVHRRLWWQR